ncbi:chromosome alignment-maintaining phosphoprotein 1-like [Poecile atricapillus]|uniref:chromosome alignment-maintaining phosphoprotein 1-like n=1 Tax=Poecile atricapillus TaxID=48891 RepID=UPI002739AF3C|nr:chromosome alignment-maintaining phosphoprotein 1-like [Poecile atricapillus]
MRASKRSRRPAGAPGPARPPGTQGRQQHLHCGSAAPGQPRPAPLGGAPPPLTAAEKTKDSGSLFSRQLSLRSTAEIARPGAAPLRSPAQPRGAPGGRAARHGRRSASSPRVTRRSCGESRRVLASRPGGPGALSLWKGRHSRVPSRSRPSRQGKASDTVPPSAPTPPAAVLLTRPEPPLSRRGIPANSAPLSPPPRQPLSPPEPSAHCPPPPAGEGARRPGRAGPGRSQAGGAPSGIHGCLSNCGLVWVFSYFWTKIRKRLWKPNAVPDPSPFSCRGWGERPRAFCAVGQWHHLVASGIVTARSFDTFPSSLKIKTRKKGLSSIPQPSIALREEAYSLIMSQHRIYKLVKSFHEHSPCQQLAHPDLLAAVQSSVMERECHIQLLPSTTHQAAEELILLSSSRNRCGLNFCAHGSECLRRLRTNLHENLMQLPCPVEQEIIL